MQTRFIEHGGHDRGALVSVQGSLRRRCMITSRSLHLSKKPTTALKAILNQSLRWQRQFGCDRSGWHSLSIGVRAEWLSQCNLVLLRALRPQVHSTWLRACKRLFGNSGSYFVRVCRRLGNAEPATLRDGFNTAPKRSVLGSARE